MKLIVLTLGILLCSTTSISAQDLIELDPSQSMCITGKGPGQDGAINPYTDTDSIAIVKNIGENEFSIRTQKQGKIIEIIKIPANSTKEIELPKGLELYFDSEQRAKASVAFRKSD